jgi:DNA-binding CsgD family transcriptional regulator
LPSATYLTSAAAKFLGSDDAEQQVAARGKVGMSARQIAVELGIAEATVITDRSSACARMGVANHREFLLA